MKMLFCDWPRPTYAAIGRISKSPSALCDIIYVSLAFAVGAGFIPISNGFYSIGPNLIWSKIKQIDQMTSSDTLHPP